MIGERSTHSLVLTTAILATSILASPVIGASLIVTPNSMAWNDPGQITLAITGLATHHTIRVERYLDANGNGTVDSGDLLLLSYKVTDGEVTLFGGVRDFNVPGDEDGATNGQITTVLSLASLPESNRGVGSYLFKVSSLDGSFTPLVRPFAVAQAAYAQSIRGTVTASGSPLGSAMVAILDESQEDGDFVAGVFADAAGTFTLNAAPGTYQLVALKPGFVADFSSLPQVTLISGINSTQNVSLLPTDRTISGRVFDEVSSEGLAGVQIFLQSAAGQAALLLTDTNGNFSAGVTSGEWSLDLSETGLRLLGYSRDNKVAVNTITGSVTGVQIALSQGRGELELVFFFSGGSFGGGTAGSIGFPTQLNYYYALFGLEDVNVPTNVFFTGPAGSGLSNTASAVFGANYEGNSVFYSSPQVYLPPFPPGGVYTVNYKNQPINFLLANPDSQNHQVLLVPTVTVNGQNQVESIQWMRRDANGNPIGVPSFMTGIEIRIDGIGGRLYDADVSADATSHVVGAPVTWTNVSSIQMVYDDVQGNQYVCFWHRGNQPLQILSSNMPTATVGTPYQFLCVGAGGQSPYSWSLQSSNLPAGLYFAPVTGEISGIPQTSGVFDLTIRLTDANSQFLTRTLSLAIQPATSVVRLETQFTINPGQFGLRMFGQAGQSYTLQYSADLSQWFPVCTTNAPSGSFELVDPNATSSMRFYRVLVNP